MDPFTTNMRQDFSHVRQTSDRPVFATQGNNRLSIFCSRRFHPQAPHTVVPGPCHETDWRFTSSPPWHDQPGTEGDPQLLGQIYHSGSILAPLTLIREDSPAPHGQAGVPAEHTTSVVPEMGDAGSPRQQGSTISCLEIVRSSLRQRGLSPPEGEQPWRLTFPTYGDSKYAERDRLCLPRPL
ncbi:hypothetical protein BSL78_08382 [Apostichopus japonicus]|uniref:Uncharacterized protein n=1 Tax=Stichopus japonicus TaxID=307972 RepID=A0A2G8L398_STIJA|nr:hypothetical protein BSL78_08382 [Apostichopus japonicus]